MDKTNQFKIGCYQIDTFPNINRQWVLEHSDAVQAFVAQKRKEHPEDPITEHNVGIRVSAFVDDFAEKWVKEFVHHLPSEVVEFSEYDVLCQPPYLGGGSNGKHLLIMEFGILKEWLEQQEADEQDEYPLEHALLRLSSDDPEQLIADITAKALSEVNVAKYLVFKSRVMKDHKNQ